MSRIALIPIDNRPVCYQLPKMIIAQAKEHELFLPNIELLGDLRKSANVDAILDWLDKLQDIDIFVVTLDTIAYGGLIPSRRSNDYIENILCRINKLFDILSHTKAKVLAFSSIMRISNNNINEEEKEYWKEWGKKIFEYSYNFHKTGLTKTLVPKNILDDYLATRKRNFEVNKYYINLKKQGIIDTLVFSKDDCSEYGLNVIEAEKLKELSKGINDIYIKTGADEIPLTLLSLGLNSEKKIKIHVEYTHPESINKISKYEDISVKESTESQIKLAGGILSSNKECDMVLVVNNFKDEQGELVMGVEVPLFKGELKIPEKPYFIADILNANGSDNNFVEQLLSSNLDKFYGYAGWNTTGNTLGCVISSALTYYCAQQQNEQAFKRLQCLRLLDDWGYQANVRNKIRHDSTNLNNNILKKYMKKYEQILQKKFSLNEQISYYLPWNRFFEAGVIFEDKIR